MPHNYNPVQDGLESKPAQPLLYLLYLYIGRAYKRRAFCNALHLNSKCALMYIYKNNVFVYVMSDAPGIRFVVPYIRMAMGNVVSCAPITIVHVTSSITYCEVLDRQTYMYI